MQEELIKRSKTSNLLRKMNTILNTKLNTKRRKKQDKLNKKKCNIEEHEYLNNNIDKLRELQEHYIQVEKEYQEFKKSSLIRYQEMETERKLREDFFKHEVESLQTKLHN